MDISDIKHLATLSRLSLSDEELSAYAKDMDSILGYVHQIKDAAGDESHSEDGDAFVENALREDAHTVEAGAHTKDLLAAAPASKQQRVEVKKVLATDIGE